MLILPLVGGYYFLIHSHHFKFYHQRVSDQRLVFNSIIAGTVLSVVAFSLMKLTGLLFDEVTPLGHYLNTDLEHLGTSLLALMIGICSPWITNRFLEEEEGIAQSIDKIGTDLEKMLKHAIRNRLTVCITLSTGKVYAGWPLQVPVPRQSEYIKIAPMLSGFRDLELKLHFTTEYLSAIESKKNNLTREDFTLVIKTEEIITINYFDISVYDEFVQADL